jgi:hypothetical protein
MGKKSSDSKAANKLAKKEKQATKVTLGGSRRRCQTAHLNIYDLIARAPKPREN